MTLAVAGGFADFPAYRGARLLCDEHVRGVDLEIHWRSFAVADEPAKVVAFYEKATKTKAQREERGGFTLRAPGNGDAVLTVLPLAAVEAYPHCAEAPRAGERAVLLVSTATRRR